MKTAFEPAGRVREVDLLAALVALWRAGASGSIRFSRPASNASFEVAGGELVGAFSSEPRFETGAILVRAGKLDPAALERLSVPPGGDAAMAALSAGVLTRREWRWGEKIRAIEILSDLLGWPEGRYIFDSEARPLPGEFSVPIPRLLLELFLRSRDRNLIEHQLGPPEAPLVRSEDFEREFATFGLTADAESVVRLIDGRTSAAEIAQSAPAEDFAVFKLLAALITLGLVGRAGPAGETEAEESGGGLTALEPWPTAEPEEEPLSSESESEEERLLDDASSERTAAWPLQPLEQEEEGEDLLGQAPLSQPSPGVERESASQAQEEPFSTPVPEEPAPASRGNVAVGWEPRHEPTETEEPARQEAPPALPPRRVSGVVLAILLAALIVGTLVVVLLRSREPAREPAAVPTALAVTAAPAGAISLPPPQTAVAASPPPSAARAKVPGRPAAAAPAPAPHAEPPKAEKGGDLSREAWVRRAERDRRRLASQPTVRYAIQLELACEGASLSQAWKHDRPAGSLWLLPTTHGGRACFRVLWGRYGSLQAARAAKSGIPGFFSTAVNHPAVVSVR